MRFQVPQFIEVEDKIFGQLTLKQFIYLAGGAGLSFIVYSVLGNLFLALIPILIIMTSVLALSFYRFNNRPFIDLVESAIKYWVGGKLFIWRKEDKPAAQTPQNIVAEARSIAGVAVPKISGSKLKDLSWSLDIKESIYSNKNQK